MGNTIISKDELYSLGELFAQAGGTLHLVGGTVRDRLLHRPISDIDLTTSLPFADVVHLLNDAEYPTMLVGAAYSVVTTALATGEFVQIATWRGDDPGRKPSNVTFVPSLEQDLARRDFTMNAIAQDVLTGEVVDPFNGLGDIGARVIRAVGDPHVRFQEDPLRILRAVRFVAQLGYTLDFATAHACTQHAPTLSTISRERVRDEFLKIIMSQNPRRAMELLGSLGLLKYIAPELEPLLTCVENTPNHAMDSSVWDHTISCVERAAPDVRIRLGAVLHDIGKPSTLTTDERGTTHCYGHAEAGEPLARAVCERLKCSNAEIDAVVAVVRLHMRRLNIATLKAARRLVADAGEHLDTVLGVMIADAQATSSFVSYTQFNKLIEGARATRIESPLDGHEIMQLTGLSGPPVGKIKNMLRDAVIDGVLKPTDIEKAKKLVERLA